MNFDQLNNEFEKLKQSVDRLRTDLVFMDETLFKAIEELLKYDQNFAINLTKEVSAFLKRKDS